MKRGKNSKSISPTPNQVQNRSNPINSTQLGWPQSNPNAGFCNMFRATPASVHNSNLVSSSSTNLLQSTNQSQPLFSPLPVSAHKDGFWWNRMQPQQVSSNRELSIGVESHEDERDECLYASDGDVLENEGDETEDGLEPCEGMVFDSLDEAQRFYYCYARRVGFGIRVDRTHTSAKTGAICSRVYVCSKIGLKKPNKDGVVIGQKRQQCEQSEGCKAKIVVTLSRNEKWVISSCVKEHNHSMAEHPMPSSLRSHRHMDDVHKGVSLAFPYAEVNPKGIMSVVTGAIGGVDKLQFMGRDVMSNVFHKKRREANKGDAQTTIELLDKMKEQNQSFFYKFQLDDERRLTNIFWVDARSRIDYLYFGDVTSFDIVYNTNIYGNPFVPIIGVNHHNQTVLFGCGLLHDESTESLIWLFKTWLEAMYYRPPAAIITSQEPAILEAVAKVFPESHHRLCLWHIMRKFRYMLPKHLPDDFKNEMKTCIHKSKTIDEFETKWEVVLKKFELSNNEWLKSLYQIRHQWVPAYLREKFFAEMYTTTRIRSFKPFFNLNVRMTLVDFLKQYCRAVNDIYRQENIADYESKHECIPLITNSLLEMQAAKIYTKSAFLKFQKELKKSENFLAEMKGQVGEHFIFVLSKSENASVAYTVSFDVSERKPTCTCHHFEYAGIVCRHILKIFSMYNITELPPHQMLKRWTKGAKEGAVFDENGTRLKINFHDSHISRYSQFYNRMNQLADRATSSPALYKMVSKELDELEKKIDAFKSVAKNAITDASATEGIMDTPDQTNVRCSGPPSNIVVHDPVITNMKSNKPGTEISNKLPRQCKTCLRYGVKHDSRNCPRKNRVFGLRNSEDDSDESSSEVESWTEMAKPRQCKTCFQYGVNHDSRNCPSKRNYLITRGADDQRNYLNPKLICGTEIAKKLSRQCKTCLQHGVNHDSRNCPAKEK